METEILNVIWFILIGVLFSGFFALAGFDFGSGIVGYFLSKEDKARKSFITAIGSTWEMNQVWLITAGGAMFAAFPSWYSTFFSAYYLPLVLVIFSLIIRGLSLEYREKIPFEKRGYIDFTYFLGNLLLAILWGVVLGNSFKGIPVNESMIYTGGFFNLLSPYAILGGLVSLSFFVAHGSNFLNLKGPEEFKEKVAKVARVALILTFILAILFYIYTLKVTTLLEKVPFIIILLGFALPLISLVLSFMKKYGSAFVASFLIPFVVVAVLFLSLFPAVLVSSTDVANNLTITNASSSQYTLKLMFIVTCIFLPIVLAYSIWIYTIFSKRVGKEEIKETY